MFNFGRQCFKNKITLLFLVCLTLIFSVPSNSFALSKLGNKTEIIDPYDEFDDFADFDFGVTAKKEIYDPFEPLNRKVFLFNEFFDQYFFEHVAIFYQKFIPKIIRKSFRNFLNNITAPFTIINSSLQGDFDNSMASFSSFLINSTLGIGGLIDVAQKKDINYYKEDFGQTFAKYGLGPGPYLVLPFLGPSNLRDSSGIAVQNSLSPLSINIFKIGDDELVHPDILLGFKTASFVDNREFLLNIISDLRKNSFDLYTAMKSAYSQNRIAKINNENR